MYKNMVFLDDSQDSVLSRSFFEILTDDHKYPSLVNFNLIPSDYMTFHSS